MKNLFVNIWTAVKTLLAALKQKFLTHPAEVVAKKAEDVKTEVEAVPTAVEHAVEEVSKSAE